VQCMKRIRGSSEAAPTAEAETIGGGSWDFAKLVLRSGYLLAICAFVALLAYSQSFLDFQKSNVVDAHFKGSDERTAVFAWMEFAVQALTLTVQLFVTGRVMRTLGVSGALLVLPAACLIGFVVLGAAHSGVGFAPLGVMMVFVVLQRGLSHSLMRPAREALFTVTSREEKYKAKSFIDTFVMRGGDALAASSFDAVQNGLHGSLATLAFVAAPVVIAWGAVGLWLGRLHRQRT